MQLIATGDAVVTRRIAPLADPGLERVRSLLGNVDLALTNLETALPATPTMPAAVPQGIPLAGANYAVDELRWLNIGAANYANNHVLDFSVEGLVAALNHLDITGFPYAGAGRTLGEARTPVFVDTVAGRVAMIGVCSSTAERSLAAEAGAWTTARPGINPLRFRTLYQVTDEQFRAIQEIDEAIGTAAARRDRVAASLSRAAGALSYLSGGAKRDALEFADRYFVIGDTARVLTSPHDADLEALVRSVEYARSAADVVAVSIHCHEGAHDGWNTPEVPDFLTSACHAWIDAGADVVLGHGPHCLRPVEVYRGRPILYSLGNFVQTINTVSFISHEAYEKQGLNPTTSTIADYFNAYSGFDTSDRFWVSVIARLNFETAASSVELIPISLRKHEARHRKGLPTLADEAEGRAILTALAQSSAAAFGTAMRIERHDGGVVGRIDLG